MSSISTNGISEAWRRLPSVSKLIVCGLALVLALSVAGGSAAWVSHWKDQRFERKEAERQTERQNLERQRDEALGRAALYEKQAEQLRVDAAIAEIAVKSAGQKAEAVKTRLEDENKRYEEDAKLADSDVSAAQRCEQLCARAKKLGLIKQGADCGCVR